MIIGLHLEENAFEQDIRELLMAFYPGCRFCYGSLEEAEGQCLEDGGLDLMVSGRFLTEDLEKGARRGNGVEQECGDQERGDLSEHSDGQKNCRYHLTVERRKDAEREAVGRADAGRNSAGEEKMGLDGAAAETGTESPVIARGLFEARENLPFAIDRGDRAETKNRIKRRLYFLLMLDTGRQLPWGALTGIRPVKIPEAKLVEGWEPERISAFMEENYLTGAKKRQLSLEIAGEERRLLSRLDYQKGCSLYVGIPFCPTTCLYCSFTSYPIAKWQNRLDEYLDALEQELLLTREYLGEERELQTIYVGGGTPTSLPEDKLERLMEMIGRIIPKESLREFTVEAGRPDSITGEKLRILKAYGVGRISINPQSMNQRTLDLIGRRHTVEQVEEVFAMARERGFDNINMDLILGLPGEGKEEVLTTLSRVKSLSPESLTVHCLALKRAARLNLEKDRYAGYPMASGEAMDELVELAAEAARDLGMKPYYLYRQKNMAGNLENVGYAQGDKACLYNILMMEEKHTVFGCGAGTTTKVVIPGQNRVERQENMKNIQEYLPRFAEVLEKKRRFFREMEGLF